MDNTPYTAHPTSHAGASPTAQTVNVVVRDIQMSFGSMVVFIIKWVLASIPAMIILLIIFALLGGLFGGIFAGLLGIGR